MRRAALCVLLLATATARAQDPAPEAFRSRHVVLDLAVDHAAQRLSGSITYELENWTAQPADRVSFVVNRLMDATAVRAGGRAALRFTQGVVRFRDDPMRQVTQVRVQLARPVPAGGRTTVRIEYAGNLVGYTEVGWLYVRDRIDSAFTILREDALAFPVIGGLSDATNRKRPRGEFTYDATIRVPARYLVATGGALHRTPHDDGTVSWRYVSGGASPFLNVSVAPFDTIFDGGVYLFHFRADSVGARRTMRSTQSALRLLTQWFGPPRAALNLTITEIPDGWGSQANLVGGIIQSARVFRDPGRTGELYHELSHLWNARDTELPSPRWNEGLASFLEGVLRERLDGWTGRPDAETATLEWLKTRAGSDSLLRTVPPAEYGRRALTDYSYSVGDVMFAALYDLVGEEQFKAIVGGYYQKYAAGGSTRELVAFAKATSSRSLDAFFDDWLFTTRWVEVIRGASSIADVADHYRTSGTRGAVPGLARTDAVRLAEAFRVSDALGELLWPGWRAAPFAVLLVTPEREYLLRHPAPTREFTALGVDSILGEAVWARPRTFPPDFQATFPAVGGVPTIVIGTAERTISQHSTRWVLTLLHERFHQVQYSRPDYYAGVAALRLQRGDSTGMWMLNFPFPYAKAPVPDRFSSLAQALGAALAARDSASFAARLASYAEAKRSFRESLTDDEARYLAFQFWQEGVARYSEVRFAQLADAEAALVTPAFRALPDFRSYGDAAAAMLGDMARELAGERLAVQRRTVVYNFGAAEGLVLDRAAPTWRERYFGGTFSLDAGFGLPR
jgi:hypothetical protein